MTAELDGERLGPEPPPAARAALPLDEEPAEVVVGDRALVLVGIVALFDGAVASGEPRLEPRDDAHVGLALGLLGAAWPGALGRPHVREERR